MTVTEKLSKIERTLSDIGLTADEYAIVLGPGLETEFLRERALSNVKPFINNIYVCTKLADRQIAIVHDNQIQQFLSAV